VTRQRSTLSRTDYEKAAAFLKAMGVTPVQMEVYPGKATMTLSKGEFMGLSFEDEVERERAKDRWHLNVSRRKKQ
jgi:hypothetical protein